MADQNRSKLALFLEDFYDETEDTMASTIGDNEEENPEYQFVTQSTFREPESDHSSDEIVLDSELFTFDPLADEAGAVCLSPLPMTPKLTAITPLTSTDLGGFSQSVSTPDFSLKTDLFDDSSDDDAYLIQLVKTPCHVKKSVGNPDQNAPNTDPCHVEKSDSNPDQKTQNMDPDIIDFTQCPPDLNPEISPTKEPPTPVQLFKNKLSLSSQKEGMVSILKSKPPVQPQSLNHPDIHTSGMPENKGAKPKTKTSTSNPRFYKANEKEIHALQHNAKAERTHQQTNWGVQIFKDWLESEGKDPNFEQLSASELGDELTPFFAGVRQKDGKKYSRSSLNCLRASLHRHLTGPPFNRQINLQTDGEFAPANRVIKGVIRQQKKKGEDTSIQHPPITTSDLALMYSSGTLSDKNPTSLLFKTFFEIALHFGRRGREGLRDLQKTDIIYEHDDNSTEYATLAFNPSEKNHQGLVNHQVEHSQRMFETGFPDCPVKSLKNYISKLNPDANYLFQRPKKTGFKNSQIWYHNSSLGVNTIGKLMSDISFQAGLSRRYINHSIRSTCITALKKAKIDPSDICSVTGHRNIGSLDSYSRTDDETRHVMSHKLSHLIGKKVAVKSEKNEEKSLVATPTKKFRNSAQGMTIPKILAATTPTKSPVQRVKPLQRVTPERNNSPQPSTSWNEPSTSRNKPSTSRKGEIDKDSEKKTISKKLDFPAQEKMEESLIPQQNPTQKRENTGQTIIIETGSVVHIHYH